METIANEEDTIVHENEPSENDNTDLPENGQIIEISSEEDITDEVKAELGLDECIDENTDELAELEADEEEFEVPELEAPQIDMDLSGDYLGNESQATVFNSCIDIYDRNHFYSQLSPLEKEIYNAAKSKLTKGKNSFTFKSKGVAENKEVAVNRALSALMVTNIAECAWRDPNPNAQTTVKVTSNKKKKPTYTYKITVPKSRYYNASLAKQANQMLNQEIQYAYNYAVNKNMINYSSSSTYYMIEYFNDWFMENTSYQPSMGLTRSPYNADPASEDYYYSHSAYGPLLRGYGVCEGYSLALSMMLDKVGITNVVAYGAITFVTSSSKIWSDDHVWNYVMMPNGKWYVVDVTQNKVSSDPKKVFLLGAAGALVNDFIGTTQTIRISDYYPFNSIYARVGGGFSFPTLAAESIYIKNDENISLSLNYTSYILKPKKKLQLKATIQKTDGVYTNYYSKAPGKWFSSNPAVASVTDKGKVTAKKPGFTNISYETGGMLVTCNL